MHPQQPSPYFPASRLWRNRLALHVESMPGAPLLGDELNRFANAGRALDERRLIDRDAVFRLKRAAFDRLFSWWTAHAEQDSRTAFSAFCAEHGTDLRLFATYCALAERHGGGWQAWPPSYHSPTSGRVARFAREHEPRVQLHIWLQWQLEVQLARAGGRGCELIGDLAVGFDSVALSADVAAPARSTRVSGLLRRVQRGRTELGASSVRAMEAAAPLTSSRSSRPCGQRCEASAAAWTT